MAKTETKPVEVEDAYQAHIARLHEQMDAAPQERRLKLDLSDNACEYILDVLRLVKPTDKLGEAAHKEIVSEMTRSYRQRIVETDPKRLTVAERRLATEDLVESA